MKAYTPSRSPCPIARAARVIGDGWAMLIVREAFLGAERFEQFMERLDISRAALSSRLRLLVEAGVLERVPPQGKRAAYRLTAAGRELGPVYKALRDWGDAWLFAPGESRPPMPWQAAAPDRRKSAGASVGKAPD